MQSTGRERRRKGPINKLRRLLYGLLLAAASGRAAAGELPYFGSYTVSQAASTAQQALQVTLQGLVLLHADHTDRPDTAIEGRGYPSASPDGRGISLDTMTARMQEPALGRSPLLSVAVTEGGSVRDGVGFDLAVPDFGRLHLSLHTRHNAKTDGKRWSLGLADAASGEPESKIWSLGGSLEMVRTVEGGRHMALVPELLIDLSDQRSRYLPFEASVKFAHWRSVSEKYSLEDQVPQITFKWRL